MPEKREALAFAITDQPTPVFKKDDLHSRWDNIEDIFKKRDPWGQFDPLESILQPGEIISVLEQTREGVYKILVLDIPGFENGEYYIAKRSLKLEPTNFLQERPVPRLLQPPSGDLMEARLRWAAAKKIPYLWGGTCPEGVPGWDGLNGLDCSGLFTWMTDGFVWENKNGARNLVRTPRNTTVLAKLGDPVLIEGLSAEQIQERLRRFDLLVQKGDGHVVISLSREECGECRLIFRPDPSAAQGEEKYIVEPSFVKIRPTLEVLQDFMQKRIPVNEITDQKTQFLARHWYEAEAA